MIISFTNVIGAIQSLVKRVITDNLKMWLGFETSSIDGDKQITPDKSGNNNVGELFTGKAIFFDGNNDYIDVSGFSMSGSVSTFAFWINSNDTLGRMIDINPNRFIISFDNNQLSLYDGSWKNFGTINTNVWNRCVILTSGTSAKCYVNGVQLGGEKTITALNIGSATAAIIGANYVHSGSFFDGEMSDFQIYNAYWSTDDIAYDYANPQNLVTDRSGTSITLSNLKAYWAMSEGDGLAAYDSSGEGNNGTLNGNIYFTRQPRIPQLGMMNWSKGSNSLTFSEDFSNSVWTKGTGTSVTGGFTDPLGGNTAYKASYDGVGSQPYIFDDLNNTTNIRSIWARTVSGTGQIHLTSHNSNSNSLFNLTTEWQRVSAIPTEGAGIGNYYLVDFRGSSNLTEVLVWGAQIDDSTTLGNYRLTSGAATSNSTVIPRPNNTSQDIFGNAVRDRLNSFNLDGVGYASVANSSSIKPTNALSIECWIKTSDISVTSKYISDADVPTTRFFLMQVFFNTQSITKARFKIDATEIDSAVNLTNNTWYYIAGTWDGSTMKLYVDDNTPVTVSKSGSITYDSDDLFIGSRSGTSEKFNGLISDVRLYDRALSADEVENNYNAGLSAHS